MEPKRKNSRFSLYEIAVLREHPYTHEVRQKQISFTAEFKEILGARQKAERLRAGTQDVLQREQQRHENLSQTLRLCSTN